MFNLVGKRYLFLLISLIIIVPGLISLVVRGLDVGIDFAGGTTVELRPANPVTVSEMTTILKPFKLADLQIVTGNDTTVTANQTVWIRLNTQVDSNVEGTIQNTLKGKYGSGLSVKFTDLSVGKGATVAVVTGFAKGVVPQISDIETLLGKLPNTGSSTSSSVGAATTPTPAAGATATPPAATATASAKATGTATAKGTPTVTASPTATATTTTQANIPVKVVDIQQGKTTQTVNILTGSVVDNQQLLNIQAAIYNQSNNYVEVLDNASVTGSVASETTRNAVFAVIAASLFILLYVSFAFRKVAKPWRYGACAIIALLHDVLVVLGVFSILGWLFHIQIDALFITALLTVVGFSVHDTIVVFDRIRENMQRRTSESFEQVVNASLVQTMTRSLNTSLTVLVTLTALTLFVTTGSVHNFTLALLIGIFSGTYSSIFNASMLLVIWEKGELGLNRFRREYTPDGRPVRRERNTERELARTR